MIDNINGPQMKVQQFFFILKKLYFYLLYYFGDYIVSENLAFYYQLIKNML